MAWKTTGKKWQHQAVSQGRVTTKKATSSANKVAKKKPKSVLTETQKEADLALAPTLRLLKASGAKEDVAALSVLKSVVSADTDSLVRAQQVLERLLEEAASEKASRNKGQVHDEQVDRKSSWSPREVAPRNPAELESYLVMLLRLVKILLVVAVALKGPATVEGLVDSWLKNQEAEVTSPTGSEGSSTP
jgi:hypothetical protein